MFKRLILAALVLGVSLVLFSQVNSDTLPEKYVKKVIIQAKWGNEPGEFGYSSGGPGCGPSSIAIDSLGNIYILDNMHGAVKKYDRNGKMVDEYKNEFFHSASTIAIDNLGMMYIETMDASHNIILEYSIKDGSTQSFLFPPADTSYHVKIMNNRIIVLNKGKDVFDSKTFGKKEISKLSAPYREHMEVQEDGSILIRGYNSKSGGIRIDIPKKYSEECNPYPIKRFLGRDIRGNIYVVCTYLKKVIGGIDVVYKYSPKGKLLAMVVLPEPEVYYEGLTPERGIKVDKEGSIYAMIPYKDGLRIYKFIQK